VGNVKQQIKKIGRLPFYLFDVFLATGASKIFRVTGFESLIGEEPTLIYIHYSKNDILTDKEVAVLSAINLAGLKICLVINSDNPTEKGFEGMNQ
jgi:hypothetical protein